MQDSGSIDSAALKVSWALRAAAHCLRCCSPCRLESRRRFASLVAYKRYGLRCCQYSGYTVLDCISRIGLDLRQCGWREGGRGEMQMAGARGKRCSRLHCWSWASGAQLLHCGHCGQCWAWSMELERARGARLHAGSRSSTGLEETRLEEQLDRARGARGDGPSWAVRRTQRGMARMGRWVWIAVFAQAPVVPDEKSEADRLYF